MGRVKTVSGQFSIFPELHSHVLEIWTAIQHNLDQSLGTIIHFSSANYGEYWK